VPNFARGLRKHFKVTAIIVGNFVESLNLLQSVILFDKEKKAFTREKRWHAKVSQRQHNKDGDSEGPQKSP